MTTLGHNEEQQSTYEDFSKTVYETLLKDVDRRGYEHNITFSAQDDAWEMCWRERTGIPLGAYEARWNRLEDHDADPHFHPGDPWNRDPHVTAAQFRPNIMSLKPRTTKFISIEVINRRSGVSQRQVRYLGREKQAVYSAAVFKL